MYVHVTVERMYRMNHLILLGCKLNIPIFLEKVYHVVHTYVTCISIHLS
jgi:hypothetical protein